MNPYLIPQKEKLKGVNEQQSKAIFFIFQKKTVLQYMHFLPAYTWQMSWKQNLRLIHCYNLETKSPD